MKAILFTLIGVTAMIAIAVMSGLQFKPKPKAETKDQFEDDGCLEISTNTIVEIDTVGDSVFIYIIADSIK
jgi:hypothetical protein